jgi:SAM-dependent methyltransferase
MEYPDQVARYWDEHREKVPLDPAFWMAHPLCRAAINRRISGNPDEWPLDYFKRVHAQKPFRRGLSWGSGTGVFERGLIRTGIVQEIDAFDLSPASVEQARETAAAEDIPNINYQVGDFNDPRLRPNRYDIVFFQASLHHVAALERLFRRLAFALQPRGAIYVDCEFIGPSRNHWTTAKLRLAQAVLDMIPSEAKLFDVIGAPVVADDSSEAIRSDEIEEFLRTFFDFVDWKPFGGQIVDVVFPNVSSAWANSPQGHRYTKAMLAIEESELEHDPSASHHLFAYGTLKPVNGLARPLARQAVQALGRRLRTWLAH